MLKICDLQKTFHAGTVNEVHALRGVTISIGEGSFTAVIGTNGSGKSTLLNAVAGTFRPDTGNIVLKGRDITGAPEYKRAGYIGRVFQNPFAGTAEDMSIAENLVISMRRGHVRGLRKALTSRVRNEMKDRVRT